jgi:hypothetical protein
MRSKKLLVALLITNAVFACSWDHLIWIPRDESADPLYRFVKGDKAGYIDSKGKVVIPASLPVWGNSGSEFHDGLLEIGVSSGRYVDRTGKVVVDPGLHRGWDFSDGLAAAMKQGEKLWGFIDTSGKFAISPRFATSPNGYVYPFSDGLAAIEVGKKTGYIDRTGQFKIDPQFVHGSAFENGAALVVTAGPCWYVPDGPCPDFQVVGQGPRENAPACKFQYIDKTGRKIGGLEFEQGRAFSEGLAPVRIDSRWGYIDFSGKLVIAAKFDDARPFHSGLARIRAESQSGYVDKSGAIVIPAQYEYEEDFSEGFAVVRGSKGYQYIDKEGRDAGFGNFAAASPFFKGLAHVRLLSGRGFAYIDQTGRRVFEY